MYLADAIIPGAEGEGVLQEDTREYDSLRLSGKLEARKSIEIDEHEYDSIISGVLNPEDFVEKINKFLKNKDTDTTPEMFLSKYYQEVNQLGREIGQDIAPLVATAVKENEENIKQAAEILVASAAKDAYDTISGAPFSTSSISVEKVSKSGDSTPVTSTFREFKSTSQDSSRTSTLSGFQTTSQDSTVITSTIEKEESTERKASISQMEETVKDSIATGSIATSTSEERTASISSMDSPEKASISEGEVGNLSSIDSTDTSGEVVTSMDIESAGTDSLNLSTLASEITSTSTSRTVGTSTVSDSGIINGTIDTAGGRFSNIVSAAVNGTDRLVSTVTEIWNSGSGSSEAWITETLTPLTDAVSSIITSTLNALTDMTTENALVSAVLDGPSFVGSLISAVIDPVTSAVNNIVGDTIASANAVTNTLIYGTVNRLEALWDNAVDGVQSTVSDFITGASQSLVSTIEDTILSVIPGNSLFGTDFSKSIFSTDEALDKGGEKARRDYAGMTVWEELDRTLDLKVLSEMDDTRTYDQIAVGTIEDTEGGTPPVTRANMAPKGNEWIFSNEMYWDVIITPFETSYSSASASPPSLLYYYFGDEGTAADTVQIYGGSISIYTSESEISVDESSGIRLPITSFEFTGDSVVNMEDNIYPGFIISIPAQRNKASRITFQLPEVVFNGRLALQSWKQAYLDYCVSYSTSSESTPDRVVVRDFRDCAYQITITKYSPQWRAMFQWNYLGIPEITVTAKGESASSLDIQELSFTIVGE